MTRRLVGDAPLRRTLILLIGMCVLPAGCERSPSVVIPNLSSVVASLRTAKDTSEDRASMVKAAPKLRIVFRRNGEELYRDARAKHNAAIAWMITALSQQVADPNELKTLLSEADEARIRFHKWYDGPARKEGVAECSTCAMSVELLVAIADLFVDIIQTHNELVVQQRQEIQQQLKACEWASWAELKAVN
jgi:hypothetical protein